jgi:protein phosphatase
MNTTYKVAILTDIHGNALALEAVLEDIKQHEVQGLFFAGDLVMNGPYPQESIRRIRSLNARSVVGNTDLEVLENNDIVARWTRQQISSDDIAYLEQLPITERITPPGGTSPHNDLLLCHSTPRSPFDLLILEPHPLANTFTAVTDSTEAAQIIQGHNADLIVYGHLHYSSSRVIQKQRIASIGSVGFPFDGDHRAAYTIASWNTQTWELREYRVRYDYEQVIQALEKSTIPFASRCARMLREANWFPRDE